MERKEDRVRMEKNKRPEITAMLSLSIQRHICPNNDPRIYWAREVTFDYATTNAVRVDFDEFQAGKQYGVRYREGRLLLLRG